MLDELRELFLQRPGALREVNGNVRLSVEREAIDILLTEGPWLLMQARLPWISALLDIEWLA